MTVFRAGAAGVGGATGCRRRGHGGELECRVLSEDRALESLERLAGVEAELVDEGGSRVLVRAERVGLAAGAVEREHQQPADVLAERMLAREHLQLGDGLRVPAEREVGLEAVLQRDEAKLLEPGDLVAGERLEREVPERRAAPQAERPAEDVGRLARVIRGEQAAALLEQALEHAGVETVVLETQHVARWLRLEHARAEGLAQARHVDLDGLERGRGRTLAPELVDERRGRDELARPHEQQREHGALSRLPEWKLATVPPRREGPEDPELHRATVLRRAPGFQVGVYRGLTARVTDRLPPERLLRPAIACGDCTRKELPMKVRVLALTIGASLAVVAPAARAAHTTNGLGCTFLPAHVVPGTPARHTPFFSPQNPRGLEAVAATCGRRKTAAVVAANHLQVLRDSL